MEFISFRAMQGDAFIIKSGETNILIDGGMPSTYGQIEDWIDENTLNAAFITHVDYDHLGGIFGLISDKHSHIATCDFYMNHPDFPSEHQGEEVGFKHGHSLKDLLQERQKEFKQILTNTKLVYGDINIIALSPDEHIVKKLYDNWQSNIIYNDGVLKYKIKQTMSEDIINKSSLILLVTCDNKSILMLGDSHASTAVKCLKDIEYSHERPLSLNLLKLSHHGSSHNTNAELLKLVSCENYYISTNGGRYDHPDVETIQLLEQRASELNTIFNIYLNYDLESDIRYKCGFPINNLNFIEQCYLELS